MRTTLLGAVSAVALLSSSLAAAAAAAPVPVDGDHFSRARLTFVSHQCSDYTIDPPVEPKVLIARGPKQPPLGKQSLGWDMQDQTTYGAGVLAHVPDPKKLKKAGIKAFFVGGSGQGSAYAVYHAPNDPGVWKGVAALPLDSTSGWHRVNVSKVEFAWRYYSGNTQNGQDSAMTLQDLAARHGGNGRGAEIGVLFGCTGETFYLDDLEVSSRKVDRTYDLGGYRTVSDIVWGSAIRKKITITFGQRLGLTGRLREKYDYSTMSGALNIQAKPAGAKWRKYDRVASGGGFKVSPARNTTYRSVFAGNEKYRASEPRTLQVLVKSKVRAGLVDPTVTKGKTFTAAGRILPGRSGKVLLQRYVHKKWRTIKAGHAGSTGRYRISLVASSTGTSFWRVVATNGGGNLGNHSNQMKLKVTAPRSSGGGGGGDTDPPPPPDDPPPPTEPPPPSHRGTAY